MTRVELATKVFDDFDRIVDHLEQFDIDDSPKRIGEIIQAIDVLSRSPLIGRPVRGGKRELIIGKESRGYIALYRFIADIDTVFVLAVRSQRESGYKRKRRRASR